MKKKIICMFLAIAIILNVMTPICADAQWRNGFDSYKDDNTSTGKGTGIQHTLYANSTFTDHIGWFMWDQYVDSKGVSRKKVYYLPVGFLEKDAVLSIRFEVTGIGVIQKIDISKDKVSVEGASVDYSSDSLSTGGDMISYSVRGSAHNLVGYHEYHKFSTHIYNEKGEEMYLVQLQTILSLY